MKEESPFPDPDWVSWMKEHAGDYGDELDLTELETGDCLKVVSGHTDYFLRITDLENRDAELVTNRPDRPVGSVRIMGCTFGLSSSIKPDALFCGGSLEMLLDGGDRIHTTTAIKSVSLVRKADGPNS